MAEPTPELISRFLEGDRDAYGLLFERYRRPLERFVLCHAGAELRRHFPLEDLVQETHAAALSALPRFEYRRELSFYLWLCEIARRLVHERCRKLKRKPPPVSYGLARGRSSASSLDMLGAMRAKGASPADDLLLRENLELLALAMRDLSPVSREAILLRYLEGREPAEAAAMIGIGAGAFRVRVSRALVELRDALARLLGETDRPAANSGR